MLNRIRTIRKRWFVVIATVALLAVGLISGVAFAADARADYAAGKLHDASGYGYGDTRYGHGDHSAVMSRVAEILGVEQTALEDAFKTAIHEQADAGFAAYAAGLVTDETITQEQADAAIAWFNSRPADTGRLAGIAVATADTDKMATLLSRMVDAEKLTQEQADAVSAWHAERPDSLPEHEGKRSHEGRRHHRGDNDGDASQG